MPSEMKPGPLLFLFPSLRKRGKEIVLVGRRLATILTRGKYRLEGERERERGRGRERKRKRGDATMA